VSLQKTYKLSYYGNLLVARAALGGTENIVRKVRLLVDTGSSYTVLRVNLLKALGCDVQNPLRRMRIPTPGGIVETPVVKVPWFSCLGQRVDNFPIVAHDLPAVTFTDGLLGIDFLNRFGTIIFVKEAEIRFSQ